MDNRPKQEPRSDSVIIGENFDTLGVFDELMPGDWPRFRGADFDNISKDTTPLTEKWDTSGPRDCLENNSWRRLCRSGSS